MLTSGLSCPDFQLTPSRKKILTGLSIALVVMALAMSFGGIAWVKFQRKARVFDATTCCSANLRGIGQALRKYHQMFGATPEPAADWEALLLDRNLINPNQSRCCVRRDADFRFVYVPAVANKNDPLSEQVWLYEPLEAHWEQQANILTADGHAWSFKPDEHAAALKRSGVQSK